MQIYFSGTEQLTESLSKLNKNSGKTNPRCLVSGKGQAAFWQMPLILAGFSHWCSKESWRMNRNANLCSTHLSRKIGRRPATWGLPRARGSSSTLSVEHHYHNFQALETLIDEGTGVFAEMAVVSACQLYASHPCGSQQITMACACNRSRGKKNKVFKRLSAMDWKSSF